MKSEPLPCPGAQAVKEALEKLPASIEALVYSLAELTDYKKGEKLEVYLDEQQHPRQSLLNPLLGECQGPALCFSIPGKAFSASFDMRNGTHLDFFMPQLSCFLIQIFPINKHKLQTPFCDKYLDII